MSEQDTRSVPIGVGASAGAHGDRAAMAGDLPMVVWLRGDEPVCDEFILDADHVMVQLGIRRSRLTQISGRELRVGRMRKGRYVSPVYRQTDVDAYRAWTRPTASHLKASSVLNDAAQSLAQQKDELSEQIETGLDTAVETLEQRLRAESRAHEERSALVELRIGEALAASERALRESLRLALAPVRALEDQVAGLRAVVEQLAAAQAAAARDVAELAALSRLAREDGKRHEAGLDAALAALRQLDHGLEELSGIEPCVRAATAGLEGQLEGLAEGLASLRGDVAALSEAPRPTPSLAQLSRRSRKNLPRLRPSWVLPR
jgi:hypothetical protein